MIEIKKRHLLYLGALFDIPNEFPNTELVVARKAGYVWLHSKDEKFRKEKGVILYTLFGYKSIIVTYCYDNAVRLGLHDHIQSHIIEQSYLTHMSYIEPLDHNFNEEDEEKIFDI